MAARAATCGARSSPPVLELPLERVQADEGAAFGVAILGGVAAGTRPDVAAGVKATVKPRHRVEPNPDWIGVYAERRDQFRALYPALPAVR